jgi:hypothetical protein
MGYVSLEMVSLMLHISRAPRAYITEDLAMEKLCAERWRPASPIRYRPRFRYNGSRAVKIRL